MPTSPHWRNDDEDRSTAGFSEESDSEYDELDTGFGWFVVFTCTLLHTLYLGLQYR